MRITTGKTATIKNVDFVIADTADIVSNGWTNGGYITVGSDNSKATLKMYNCNIECKSSSIGNNENSILRADRNAASSIYMENSAINAAIEVDEGALIGGANAVYTLRDSSLKVSPSNAWLCTSTNIILYGSSSYQTSAWAPSTDIADFRNVTVAAVRDNDNNIVLTKEGTGKAVTSDTYQIYYSTDEDAFSKDTATAYTEAITGIDANTTIYAAVKYGSKPWYSDAASYTLAIDETPEEPTVEGATILQSTDSEGNQDIRFSYNTGKIDESNPIVEYGMLISLSKFEVGELTLENAAANQDKIHLSKVENVNITEASSFVASIGGVPTNLYTYKYRTVVYVKYADGSIEYSEEIERSVAGVAKSIIGYAYENRADDTLSALASELEALVESVDEGVVTLTAAGKANNGAAILAFLEENNDAISAAITKLGKK